MKSGSSELAQNTLALHWQTTVLKTHLDLGFMLHGVVGSTFKRPDLEVVPAGVFCGQRYQLQFTGQLVVLRQSQLRLGSMHKDRGDT